jgi:EAL domain-containing protein (putative c-di-GMP-specific phosphodiesterase class I)
VFANVAHRARFLVTISTGGLLALVVLVAFVLTGGVDGYAKRNADQRARLGVDLLVHIGTDMPDLTPVTVAGGLSEANAHQLDVAIARGQRAGILSDLTIWDLSGRVMFSADRAIEGSRPVGEPEVHAALRGAAGTVEHAHALDLASGKRTGVLDALEPLRDDAGHIYGVVETSLPLKPIAADAAGVRDRALLYLLVGAGILWLTLLPLGIRAARTVAVAWAPGRQRLLRAFKRALAHGEIELVYQPQIAAHDGAVDAVEALVRWRRRDRLESPAVFLHHVESSPLIAALTDRVLDLALAELAHLRASGNDLRMSVNLSAANLVDDSVPATIESALARHDIPPATLTIEITETAVLEDPTAAYRVVNAIAALGVGLAIDDFGTGNASIERLHSLPVKELKIDRSFVSRTDNHSRSYVAAIIRFAQDLGLRVVAEGIEDADTLAFLRDHFCDLAQGYYIARPLDAPALHTWLAERHPEPIADARHAGVA